MAYVLNRGDLQMAPPSRTVRYEGEAYGSNLSFFVIDSDPGAGPELHRHPYPETFIIHEGRARFRAGEEEVEAGRDDIVVVGAGEPHGFVSLGPGRLQMVCIHERGGMVTDWLEG